MSKLIPFPGSGADGADGAEEHANAETDRKRRLYEWCDRLLVQLGVADKVARANTIEELRKITIDTNAAEVQLAP
jgi:hypothetical protein